MKSTRTSQWLSSDIRFRVVLFGVRLRISWLSVLALTLSSELIPRPLDMTMVPLYAYTAAKALTFALLGFATPLAFWGFDNLGYGIAASVVLTALFECVQMAIGNGHRFSWLELVGKVALVFLGFLAGLNCRFDDRISVGRIVIRLKNPHLTVDP